MRNVKIRKLKKNVKVNRPKTRRAPVASAKLSVSSIPSIRSQGRKIVVSHTECLGDVYGSATGVPVIRSFAINPGMYVTFPWLSGIATRYESYQFRKLVFRYVNLVAATVPGYVDLVPDFDAADSPPVDHIQCTSYSGMATGSSWTPFQVDMSKVDMKKFCKDRYNRYDAPAANLDIKTYDLGNLHVLTAGQGVTTQIGWIYVDYVVDFFTPQLESQIEGMGETMIETYGTRTSALLSGASFVNGTVSAARPYTSDSFYLNHGRWLVSFLLQGHYNVAAGPFPLLSNVTDMFTAATNYSVESMDHKQSFTGVEWYEAVINVAEKAGKLVSLVISTWTSIQSINILITGVASPLLGVGLSSGYKVPSESSSVARVSTAGPKGSFIPAGGTYLGGAYRYSDSVVNFYKNLYDSNSVCSERIYILGTLTGTGLTAVSPATGVTNCTLTAVNIVVNAGGTAGFFEMVATPTITTAAMQISFIDPGWTTLTGFGFIAVPH